MIKLNSVSRFYFLGGEKIRALDEVSLIIREGEFLAVTGPSGSGKSTLLHLIAGLDQPDEGEIEVEGANLNQLSDNERARLRREKIGFVFQTFHLIPSYTAWENVLLPLEFTSLPASEKKRRVEAALKQVHLLDRAQHKPAQLSGGQQQRVAIARALVNQPRIILADEPTGNLDSQNGGEIADFLHQLSKKGITVIMVTHDNEIAQRAARRVRLKDGRIIES